MEAQTPEVKADDKKKEEEKKKGGAFGELFGSGSNTTTFGAGAGRLGAGGLSGLLATKAGIIAAVAIAATVAGVLGLVGYTAFGPSKGDKIGAKVSLFASKPPEDKSAQGAAAAGSGNSDSLSMAASANGASDATKNGAATDQAKTDASGAASADAAAKAAEDAKKAQAAAAGEATGKSARAKGGIQTKFGSNLAGAGGGSSGTSFGGGPMIASARTGSSSGFGSNGAAKAGNSRGLAGGRKFGGVGSQALGALRDQRGAITSQGAGATYDGGAGSGITGAGAGTGGSGPASSPADASPGGNTGGGNADRFPAPPAAVGTANVTPWQSAINTAEMLLAGAALLIFLAGKGKDCPVGGQVGATVMAGLAALMAGMAAFIGHQIATGPYGQVFQGNMFVAAGTFMAAGALAMAVANASGSTSDIMKYVAYGSGALGLGCAIMAAMTPKTSYPPQDFQYMVGGAPDWSMNGGSHGNCIGASAGTPGCK